MANQRGSHGPRRKTQWGGFGNAAGVAALPTMVALTAGTAAIVSQAIVVGGAIGLVDEEVTITRMIGMVTAARNADTALGESTVAIGCAVARVEAIAAGVGSLPSPESDPDFEWLYYAVFQLINPQNALRDGPLSGVQFPFDTRGQRIVRSGQSTVWIAEAESSATVCGVGGRYLLKLP